MSEDDKSVVRAQPRHNPRSRRHVPPIDATIPHGASAAAAAAAPDVRPPVPGSEPVGSAAPAIEPVTDFLPVSEVPGAPPVELGLHADEDLFSAVQREPRRSSEEVESARLEPVFGDFGASAPPQPAEPEPRPPEPRIALEPHDGPGSEPVPFAEPRIFPSESESASEPETGPSEPEPRAEFEAEPAVAQDGREIRTHEPEEPRPEEQPSYEPQAPVFEEPTIQHADVREEPELAGIAAAERPVPPRRRSRVGWLFIAAAMVLIALGTVWVLNGGRLMPAGSDAAANAPVAAQGTSANAEGLRAQIGDLEKRVAALEQRLGEQTPAAPEGASAEDQVKALGSRIGTLEDKAKEETAATPAPETASSDQPASTASATAPDNNQAATQSDASTDAGISAEAAGAQPAIRNVTPDASVNPQAAERGIDNKEGADISPATVQAATDALKADAAQAETASVEAPASLAPSSPVPPALPQPRPQFAARTLDNGPGFLQPPPSRADYDRPTYNQPYRPYERYAEPDRRDVVLRGWTVRDVYQGMALLQTADGLGMIRVRPGDVLPNGGGRITSIRRLPTGWAVMTTRGIITSDY